MRNMTQRLNQRLNLVLIQNLDNGAFCVQKLLEHATDR